MIHLTQTHISIFQLLAKYKYLTSSQIVEMGIYKRRGYFTNSLKPLLDMKKPLIDKYNFNPLDGRLESFYFLTNYGRDFLINELEYSENQIKFDKGLIPIFLKDYHHRKLTIDFHVYFYKWLENNDGEIDFLNYYFDKVGNNRVKDKTKTVKSLNRICIDDSNSFVPDINSMFTLDNKSHIFLYEQHNGKDTKRLFEQLYVHIIAISKGVVSSKYNLRKSHRVVVVCEEQSVKDSVIKRLQKIEGIENYNNHFIFKTNSELKEDFYNNWTLINGEETTFIKESVIKN